MASSRSLRKTAILYYVHDPMCSWCYAFEPRLALLTQQLPASVRLQKLLGGLAPDATTPMPVDLQRSIKQTWQRIEQKVPGIHFNFDFWARNTPIRSTYPACRAVLAASKQGRAFEDLMIHAIQQAYYQLARNPALADVLMGCAETIGLNPDRFREDFYSAEVDGALREQIALARAMGIATFPSLCLQIDDHYHAVAIDYLSEKPMLTAVSRLCRFE